MNNNEFINKLGLILQTLSLEILFKDYNNADLMNELQTQDEKYLKTIIKQNEEILKLLKERGDNSGRNSN
ncbi:MAG: hypothetical protein IKV94_02715 [Clostridia bacterium]|nr:hypothetical protein [Clostridia bacterium]MBR6517146.1 hypothetical protein [Bacilli bacterium]